VRGRAIVAKIQISGYGQRGPDMVHDLDQEEKCVQIVLKIPYTKSERGGKILRRPDGAWSG